MARARGLGGCEQSFATTAVIDSGGRLGATVFTVGSSESAARYAIGAPAASTVARVGGSWAAYAGSSLLAGRAVMRKVPQREDRVTAMVIYNLGCSCYPRGCRYGSDRVGVSLMAGSRAAILP